ncbi:unnamed protein product [Vicia faba]|uniref:FAD-binding PCMH-type domain-containing protein n=1 Tax=Vicia faba TaxID=3906 RepID=A0AAV1B8K7_VICFA|nr:unnamed protein product [Vicia faba]
MSNTKVVCNFKIAMDKSYVAQFFSVIILFLLHVSNSHAASSGESIYVTFVQCLTSHTRSQDQVSNIVYAQTNASYTSIYQAFARNGRFKFNTPSNIIKPLLIITPLHENHVQATVLCSKTIGLHLKIRSGGHDFDGISYISNSPFIMLDMFNFQNVTVNMQNETAVIQAGASLGQLYYRIWEKSKVHGFPGGVCPTVGVGGLLSGAGYGVMLRKFGLSIDQVIDAKIVDVNGRILDKKAMGEDLFWAIRGGGGASFGVILSYTVKLVSVPEKVTVFTVDKSLEKNVVDIIVQWQQVAPRTDNRLFMRLLMQPVNGEKTMNVSVKALFLGGGDELVTLLGKEFPLLGLKKENCSEMSWIEAVYYWANYDDGAPLKALLDRSHYTVHFGKRKSDYVKSPISKDGWKWIMNKMIENEKVELDFNPYGGKMSEVGSNSTAFPHRAGNLYKIQYTVKWEKPEAGLENNFLSQIRKMYSYMTPFVSKNPRSAYLNYRDLDIGINSHGKDVYEEGVVYGKKYFGDNFERLVKVKTEVDPQNFFWNEQSIPTLPKKA